MNEVIPSVPFAVPTIEVAVSNKNEKNQTILVAGASARPIVEFARAGGYRCVAIDLFCDWDTRNVCCCEKVERFGQIPKILENYEFDELLIAGGLENYPEIVERYCRILPTRDIRAFIDCRNPFAISDLISNSRLCQDNRILFPATTVDFHNWESRNDWLVKSRSSSGGMGVTTVDDYIAENSSLGQYFQRRLRGLDIGALFVANQSDCGLLGVTQQLNGDQNFGGGGFQYCGSILETNLDQANISRIDQIGKVVANAFGIRGCFGIDLILEQDRIWVLEINPRITASAEVIALTLAPGRNLVTEHLSALAGTSQSVVATAFGHNGLSSFGKAIIYSQEQEIITVSHGTFEALRRWHKERKSQSGIASDISDIPMEGTIVNPGGPLVTVKASAQEKSETLRLLHALAQDVYNIFEQSVVSQPNERCD